MNQMHNFPINRLRDIQHKPTTPIVSNEIPNEVFYSLGNLSKQKPTESNTQYVINALYDSAKIDDEVKQVHTDICEVKEAVLLLTEMFKTYTETAVSNQNLGGEDMENLQQMNETLLKLSEKVNDLDKNLSTLTASISGDHKVFDTKLSGISNDLNTRFTSVDQQLNTRFSGIDERINNLKEHNDTKFTKIDNSLSEIKQQLKDNSTNNLTKMSIAITSVAAIAAIASVVVSIIALFYK